MSEHTDALAGLAARVGAAKAFLDIEGKRARAASLETEASDASLWDDPAHGQAVTSKLAQLKGEVERYDALRVRVEDAQAMDELLADADDADLAAELAAAVTSLQADVERLELAALLSGPYDDHAAIATLQAGAGGTESMDWANMLLRMYTRWAERSGFDMEVDEVHYGEEAGIKSSTFTMRGTNVYGLLSAERGVHRLVRISPFDAQKRRQTSFAALDVIPALEREEADQIEVDESELRIDVYRSSGPGGQGVNTTDSAVRITHLPTGIVVSCQNERSQLQNKATAMGILKARLADLERQRRDDEMDQIRGERKAVDFGSQIRSYVLAPYQMVKDHRTDEEIGDPQRVLDGDLDRLIEAELRRRASG